MKIDINANNDGINYEICQNLKICNCDERIFIDRAEEFTALCRRSFAEHLDKNIKMGPAYMTEEKWTEISNGSIGQYIICFGRIIAFWLAKPDFDKKETFGKILAVDPQFKGNHIGLTLSQSRAEYLRELGMNVFCTNTSIKAEHVVRFHQRYGCKAVGMASWSNTNYYSVILRLALNPEYEISDLEAKRRFIISKIKCMTLLKEDGTSTLLSKILHQVFSIYSKIKSLRAINNI